MRLPRCARNDLKEYRILRLCSGLVSNKEFRMVKGETVGRFDGKVKIKKKIAKIQWKNQNWIPAFAGMTEEIAASAFGLLAMT